MAVYNGDKYLAQQIDSILAQTFTEWKLIICDDNSSDKSFDIIEKYRNMYPNKITAYRNNVSSGSAQANFMSMLKYSETEYTMFSDQDDIWLPNKLDLTIAKMHQMETKYGNIPLLVHTDMTVVDSELQELSHSFMKYSGLNPRKRDFNHLLVQNNISGCTMMINRAVLNLVNGVPPTNMIMHDWWIGLTASAFGKVDYIEKSTSLYRQHKNNELGAKHYKGIVTLCNLALAFIKKIFITKQKKIRKISISAIQAENFLIFYNDILPANSHKIISAYVETVGANAFQRWYRLFRFKLWRQNLVAIIGQLFLISY